MPNVTINVVDFSNVDIGALSFTVATRTLTSSIALVGSPITFAVAENEPFIVDIRVSGYARYFCYMHMYSTDITKLRVWLYKYSDPFTVLSKFNVVPGKYSGQQDMYLGVSNGIDATHKYVYRMLVKDSALGASYEERYKINLVGSTLLGSGQGTYLGEPKPSPGLIDYIFPTVGGLIETWGIRGVGHQATVAGTVWYKHELLDVSDGVVYSSEGGTFRAAPAAARTFFELKSAPVVATAI